MFTLCPVLFMRACPQATYTPNAVALVDTPWRRVHGGLTPVGAFRQPTRGLLTRRHTSTASIASFSTPKRRPCHCLWWHHVCATLWWRGGLTGTVRRRSRNRLLLVVVLLLLVLPSFFKLTQH